jgi:hypothetical protein
MTYQIETTCTYRRSFGISDVQLACCASYRYVDRMSETGDSSSIKAMASNPNTQIRSLDGDKKENLANDAVH